MFVCEVFGRRLLGGRSMVGHAALDRGIGVRVPGAQPILRGRQSQLTLPTFFI